MSWTKFNTDIICFLDMTKLTDLFSKKYLLLFNYKFDKPEGKKAYFWLVLALF